MSKLLKYQQTDSLQNQKVDSFLSKGILKLIEVEDNTTLILPKKVKSNRHIIKNEVVGNQNLQDSADFDGVYLKDFNSVPIRNTPKQVNTNTLIKEEKVSFKPTLNNSIDTTWHTLFLLLAVGLLGFIKAYNKARVNQMFKSLFSFHASEELIREEKVLFHRVNLSFAFIYIVTTTLLLVSWLVFKRNETPDLYMMLKIAVSIIVFYLFKFIIGSFLSFVISKSELSSAYTFNVLNYNYFLGVVFLPVLAIIYYSNINYVLVLNYFILPSIVVMLISRIFRLFALGIQNNFFVLYIILYICTLEILPLVVLSKFFIFD